MFAQTKRWGLDSKGKGWNRNLPFPLVAPLVPFRQSGKERKKEIEFTQISRLNQTSIYTLNSPTNQNLKAFNPSNLKTIVKMHILRFYKTKMMDLVPKRSFFGKKFEITIAKFILL